MGMVELRGSKRVKGKKSRMSGREISEDMYVGVVSTER